MTGDWCISVGSGEYLYEECMSPYAMILVIVIELGFYVLVGSGLWGIFKRIQKQKEQRRQVK